MNFSKSLVIMCIVFANIGSIGWSQTDNGGTTPPGEDPPLTIGGGWQSFGWNVSITPTNSDGPFTLTAGSPVQLEVTDAFINGDRFQVFDFGFSLGLTSVPTDDGSWTNAPDTAFADPRWSSGTFLLAAGPHSIQLIALQTATGFTEGTGYLRAYVVPEPATLLLVAAGLVGIVALQRCG